MKKKSLFILLFIFGIPSLFALEIYVAPISFIEEEKVLSKIEIASAIAREAGAYLSGNKLFFGEVKNQEQNAPVSMIDAIKVSKEERADYLLYGFVEKKEYTYRAEIRLLDFEKREIIKIFYSSDDIENYERVIKDISYKIVSYLDDLFALGIKEEKQGNLILSIPISFGYWSYISSEWKDTVTGTGAVSTGFDLIPNDRGLQNFKHKTYLSCGLNLEYRYGIGKENIELKDMRIITLGFPIRVHIESPSKEHGVIFGFGFFYEVDLVNIEEIYGENKSSLFTHIGVMGSIGYQWRLSKRIRIAVDNVVDLGFQNPPMVSFSPRIRILSSIYIKERTNKWK